MPSGQQADVDVQAEFFEVKRHELRECFPDVIAVAAGKFERNLSVCRRVDAAALAIARQIRTQYTIAYAPINQALDGSFRKIRVAVKAPDRLSVRTRTGYRAR